MTKQRAYEVVSAFNALTRDYPVKVTSVCSGYSVTIHCGTFIPSSLLDIVHTIANVHNVFPSIECFDNDMIIEFVI